MFGIGSFLRQFMDTKFIIVVDDDVLPDQPMGGYGVRLLKAFQQWCRNRQVAEINFGINSVEEAREMQRLGGFARKMGYAKVGENYVRML